MGKPAELRDDIAMRSGGHEKAGNMRPNICRTGIQQLLKGLHPNVLNRHVFCMLHGHIEKCAFYNR